MIIRVLMNMSGTVPAVSIEAAPVVISFFEVRGMKLSSEECCKTYSSSMSVQKTQG
jgi:hypothetical protein